MNRGRFASAEGTNTTGMRYVIIGNGVAGVTAALTLRAREPDAAIAIVSGESEYFFSRTALMYAYMDRLTLRDLEPYERHVWKKQSIQLVNDWVEDLDNHHSQLRLRSGGTMTFDRLLLATGSRPNLPAWPGVDKVQSGLVHFVSLQDLAACESLTRPGARAVVIGGGLIGVELVECLRHHGVEVTFLVREPWYWPVALAAEEGEMISSHIRRHGVTLLHDELIAEVKSESGRVTGVTTESGKHFECDLFGVAVGVHPAVEWLRGVTTPPRVEKGILVSPDFRTSLDSVWAAGDCAELVYEGKTGVIEQIWYSARRQGELAAMSMLGDAVDYSPPIFYNSSKFFEIEYTTTGDVMLAPAGSRHFYVRIPNREISLRIVEHQGRVIGFNMLGSRWNHNVFEQWIDERRNLAYVVPRLREAQFDVEFGRLDLSPVETAWRLEQERV